MSAEKPKKQIKDLPDNHLAVLKKIAELKQDKKNFADKIYFLG